MGHPASRTIRSRLFLVLIVAFGTIVGIAATVWRLSIEPALRLGIARERLQIARRAADQIEQFLERRIAELVEAAELSLLWAEDPRRRRETLVRLLKLAPALQEVSLVGAGGRELYRLSRTAVYTEGDLRHLEDEERFRRPWAGEVYVGEVYHPATAEPHVTIAVPVRLTRRQAAAVLAAEVNLKTLWESISHIKVGRAGMGFVVDRHGLLVAHPDYSKVLMGTKMTRHHEVREFLTSPARDPGLGQIAPGEDGRPSIGTYAVVRRTGWAVIVEEPAAVALAEVRTLERWALVLVLLAVGGVFVMSYRFSRRITRPLGELTRGVERIAEGDLSHRLAIVTGDEVETLARQFNGMAERLQRSYVALEAKIEENTRDLQALYAITTPISGATDLRGVLENALGRIVQVTGVDGAAIQLLDEQHREPALVVLHGLPSFVAPDVVGARWHDSGAAEPVLTASAPDDPASSGLRKAGFASVAFLPLSAGASLFGVMTLASRHPDRLVERERPLLGAIAHQISVAVQNARLYEEARRAMAALEAKNVELDSFVYSVSHDLKAPLVTLHGMTGIVLEDYSAKLDRAGVHYLERIQANVEQMERLIQDLLVLSRVGREGRTAESVNMREVVDDVLAGLGHLAEERGVKVVVRDDAVLRGIRTQIEQVYANLIGNAIKYAGDIATPLVEIGAIDRGEHVECYVRDNGIGIDPSYHQKVFEIFQRLKEIEAEGTGVGLALVKKIVEGAGGRVWVESTRRQGATFRFTWPKG
ncbi:MAG: HAMP domain-containing protein [Candidatus Rokubacteria bacterium]|nr:HAMP domain-containing protein [Candidatus Rokubacteria bacterium]